MFIAMNEEGQYGKPIRVEHEREKMRAFLEALPAGSQIALEPAKVITGWWMKWSEPGTGR